MRAPPEANPDFFPDLPEFLVGYLCRLSWAEHPPEVLSILDREDPSFTIL